MLEYQCTVMMMIKGVFTSDSQGEKKMKAAGYEI